jgi:hypothetical protein
VEQIILADADGWVPAGWPAREVVAPPPGDDDDEDEPHPATASPNTKMATSEVLFTFPIY